MENDPQFDPIIQEVKKFSRAYKDLEKQINRYTNQLDELLSEYFPEFLDEEFPDLTTKTALRLLNEYSSLNELRKLEVDELSALLQNASQGQYGESWPLS